MSELTALQAVRLKGRVSRADLAATLGGDANDIAAVVDQLVGSGLLIEGRALRVSPDGRARLEELLTDERRHIDHRRRCPPPTVIFAPSTPNSKRW